MRILLQLNFGGNSDKATKASGNSVEECIHGFVAAIVERHKKEDSLDMKSEDRELEELILLAHDMGRLMYKLEGSHWGDDVYLLTMARTDVAASGFTMYDASGSSIDDALSAITYKFKREGLAAAINEALDAKDEAKFTLLSLELNQLDTQYNAVKTIKL